MKFLRILLKRWYIYLLLLLMLPAAATLFGRQRLRRTSQAPTFWYIVPRSWIASTRKATTLASHLPRTSKTSSWN